MTTIETRPTEPAEKTEQTKKTEQADTASTTQPTATAAKSTLPTLLIMLAGTFMTTLDVFIVNVAIPSTQRDLHASTTAIQWIVAGFGLAVGAGVITAGRLGDRYGRRRVYAIGLGVFTAASAMCGLAPTAALLVGARVLQGLGAALMGPQTLAILGTAFEGAARVRAFVAYGLTMGLAAVFGQLIGGVLIAANVDGLGWRSCFLINIPIGAVALAFVPRAVPESRAEQGSRLDIPGMAMVTLALVATVLPLIQGRSQGWPLWTWVSFALAVVLFGVFAWYQARKAENGGAPLIDPALFRNRRFTVNIVAQVVFWMGQGSFFLVFALYIQAGRGLTAMRSGLVFTAMGVGYLLASMAAAKVAQRLGRQTPAAGALLMAASLVVLIVEVRSSGTTGSLLALLPALALDGAGMGLVIGPLAGAALGSVAPEHTGAASGVVSTVMQVGGAIGVAVVGIVFYRALGAVPTSAGYVHAFTASLEVLVGVAVAVAGLLQLAKD